MKDKGHLAFRQAESGLNIMNIMERRALYLTAAKEFLSSAERVTDITCKASLIYLSTSSAQKATQIDKLIHAASSTNSSNSTNNSSSSSSNSSSSIVNQFELTEPKGDGKKDNESDSSIILPIGGMPSSAGRLSLNEMSRGRISGVKLVPKAALLTHESVINDMLLLESRLKELGLYYSNYSSNPDTPQITNAIANTNTSSIDLFSDLGESFLYLSPAAAQNHARKDHPHPLHKNEHENDHKIVESMGNQGQGHDKLKLNYNHQHQLKQHQLGNYNGGNDEDENEDDDEDEEGGHILAARDLLLRDGYKSKGGLTAGPKSFSTTAASSTTSNNNSVDISFYSSSTDTSTAKEEDDEEEVGEKGGGGEVGVGGMGAIFPIRKGLIFKPGTPSFSAGLVTGGLQIGRRSSTSVIQTVQQQQQQQQQKQQQKQKTFFFFFPLFLQ